MITRRYFIAGEIYLKDGEKTMFHKYFCHTSIFENSKDVFNTRLKAIAEDNNVSVEDVVVTKFNKLNKHGE